MPHSEERDAGECITLFLCGDVMTGRGIDQILPHPSNPLIHEPYIRSAMDYLELAEQKNGAIPRRVEWDYVWGDLLPEMEQADLRIVNLETAITTSSDFAPKGINYRMHPGNVPVLTAAGIDCCSLANNHVLDWGLSGLEETMKTLRAAGIKYVGAGKNSGEAEAPVLLDVRGRGRVLLFAFGTETSGVPPEWAAGAKRPGINFPGDLSPEGAVRIGRMVQRARRDGDIAIASIHWGKNWGYGVPAWMRTFAHALIEAGIDLIHGHSYHHVKGIEVYKKRLILYGCGDLLSDYEGIGGYEEFRDDLGLIYFPDVSVSTGELLNLRMLPTRVKKFRLNRASRKEAEWLREVLNAEGRALGTGATIAEDNTLRLEWR
jgi:poly-gamma-glutamate synthesis protein (capsule biosynthesis protein)